MATIQSRLWTFRPWDLLPPPLFSRLNPFDMDAAHNGASSPKSSSASSMAFGASGSSAAAHNPEDADGSRALVAIPAAPRLAEISSAMANGLDKPQEHLPAKCATTKELDSFASVKLHPDKNAFHAQLDAIQKADPNVQSAVVGDSEAPSNGTQESIILAVVDESSIHVCQFIALVVFTTLNVQNHIW
ncbi:hypothetical protein BDZ89DRAFT_1066969 [Hymenopellis radicata]|nr:hypothetical protein BDZ89DRAFT_1066969 [Hymenopellis radicata]